MTDGEKAECEVAITRAIREGILPADLKYDFDVSVDAVRPGLLPPTIEGRVELWAFDTRTPGMPHLSQLHGQTEPSWDFTWNAGSAASHLETRAKAVVALSEESFQKYSPFEPNHVPYFAALLVHEIQHARHEFYVLGLVADYCEKSAKLSGVECETTAESTARAFYVDLFDELASDAGGVDFAEPGGNQLNEAFAYNQTFLLLADAYERLERRWPKAGRPSAVSEVLRGLRAAALFQHASAAAALDRGKQRFEAIKQTGLQPKCLSDFFDSRPARGRTLLYPFPRVATNRTGTQGPVYFDSVIQVQKGKDAVQMAIEGILKRSDPASVAFEMDSLVGS